MARQLERAELTHCRGVRHCQLARGSSERLWLLELTEGMQAARGAHELHDRPLYERAHPTADYFFNRAELDAPPVELDLPIRAPCKEPLTRCGPMDEVAGAESRRASAVDLDPMQHKLD